MTIAEFISARYDELEDAAKAAADALASEDWIPEVPADDLVYFAFRRHIAANDPAYVLADIAAKRKILGLLAALTGDRTLAELRREAEAWRGSANLNESWLADIAIRAAEALLAMAEPFSGHPDYEAAIRP